MVVFADNPALHDHWYVVATADGLVGPIGVELLGRRHVVWRDDTGRVRAALDRCPHREAPLSLGAVVDGCLTCAYHGWRYAGDGRCVEVPSSGPDAPVPPTARLASVGAEERYGLVWLCPGNAAESIPSMPWEHDDAFRRINTEVEEWAVAAPRMTDNFLDIAHFPWVHTGTFGAGQEQRVPVIALEALDDDWYGYRYEVDAQNPAAATTATASTDSVVHRWMTTGFSLPFNVRSTIRYADGLEHVLLLATTPIDDETSYFTFVVWRNDDRTVDAEATIAFDRAIGAEDRAMLEAIPGGLTLDRTGLVSVAADRPSVEWRRRLVGLLDGEETR